MPTVTYNGQSFAIDGRRIWILGASLQYARIPPELWADRIAAAAQAGFNTIEVACPWLLHEPRPGRFNFEGAADVRSFVRLCGDAGLWVMLKPGPYIGSGLDGGGLPAWLLEVSGLALREANEPFLERVSTYFRRLFAELAELELTRGGPILLVQSEHAWLCAAERQIDRYLREITRFIRENGMAVPVINANDLWQESTDTIDTWRGRDQLLAHLRQLRSVRPEAPRLVSAFEAAELVSWGDSPDAPPTPDLVNRLAQVLAAGAQPVVAPFHGGTNFGFLGGRLAGRPDGFLTTSFAPDAPLGESGVRGRAYAYVKRLVTFVNHFGHVFAELDPDYHPIGLDVGSDRPAADSSPGPRAARPRQRAGNAGEPMTAVPLRGGQGQVVFVFAGDHRREATLLLEDGIRLPIHLGDLAVGWYLFDVDLHGSGRLDYANLSPMAMVDRSVVVFQGPAEAPAFLSINGSLLEATVPKPGADRPLVMEHKGITLVICNERQADATYCTRQEVFVGVRGLNRSGQAWPAAGFVSPCVIGRGGAVRALEGAAPSRRGRAAAGTAPTNRRGERPVTIAGWRSCSGASHVTGESPRFATLDGPQTLTACGAPSGYGWYRVRLKAGGSRSHLCQWPRAGHRVHLYVDGRFQGVLGVGRGADPHPFNLQLKKGDHTLVLLAENFGRFADGNDLAERCGVFGHLYSIRPLRARPRRATAEVVDPFKVRGMILGGAQGQLSESEQAAWVVQHPRRTPLLIELDGVAASGTVVLNGRPIAYYAGATGGCYDRILIDPKEVESLRRGRNEVRFAPDPRQPDALDAVMRAARLYACEQALTEGASWSFAKWEPPPEPMFESASAARPRSMRRVPCWWRGAFGSVPPDGAAWVETAGLSKGHVFINGRALGRYFAATVDGKAVGPQHRLYVPHPWLHREGENEIIVFDEHGFEPGRVRLVVSEGDA